MFELNNQVLLELAPPWDGIGVALPWTLPLIGTLAMFEVFNDRLPAVVSVLLERASLAPVRSSKPSPDVSPVLSLATHRTHRKAEIKALLYQTMGIMAKTPVWGLALLAAGAGIGEEAFFRGFLQSGFQQLALRTDVAPAVVRGGTLFHRPSNRTAQPPTSDPLTPLDQPLPVTGATGGVVGHKRDLRTTARCDPTVPRVGDAGWRAIGCVSTPR